ncbi:iron-containing alcohol dehydrogenase [Vibrio kyushuensis]|uniref:iron-containing alcohol dehydrogenase n=1 Tax=Vibrio kyushuensis TaxID=2910249 RepID=UPI003D12569D
MKFNYVNPTQILFGQNQISAISEQIAPESKVLVIYGGGSIKSNGVYDQVTSALKNHNWVEFSGVEPNPTRETLDKAVALVRSENVDYILAVGGGSVIDGSKYVAAAAMYDGEGWDIPAGKHQVTQAVPLGSILTLPATGSESNGGSVISNAATKEKLAFMSPLVQPRFAVMDPDVMKTLPDRQLVNGVVDAWVHVCEQYLTTVNNAYVQDGYAEVLLRSLLKLGGDFDKRDSDEWRANLMWSANQALNGLIGVGVAQDWATHMIGHELTAAFGVDHARSLAIVQPSLMRNQLATKRGKLEQMGVNVFGLAQSDDLAERTIEAIESFYQGLGVATQLTDYGLTAEQAVDKITAQIESHGLLALGEHQAITLTESRKILEAAIQ